MNEQQQRPPHQQLTTQDNGLTSMQEVIYKKDFKQADKEKVNIDRPKDKSNKHLN